LKLAGQVGVGSYLMSFVRPFALGQADKKKALPSGGAAFEKMGRSFEAALSTKAMTGKIY